MNTQKFKTKFTMKDLHDYIMICLAMFICSIGWCVFLLPNHITMGGTPGISSVLFWGFGIPVQVSYLVINIILLVSALRILGFSFCIKTIYAVLWFTLFVSIIQGWIGDTKILHDQLFMAAVVGACFLGCGIGLGLASNGSTGGSDVVGAMINKYYDISLGRGILLCDVCIITSSYLVLHNWEQVIYGYVVLFISSTCVDYVVNMTRRSVQFFIISDKYKEIGKRINEEPHRGCTLINAQGFFSGNDVKMLFVLAKKSQSGMIFRLIDEIDPSAFVSQSAVIGVYGRGFDRFKVRKKHPKTPEIPQ
jgi:uncharacterized membrane-anchored protein YitT (DUF2179 family)